MNYIFVVFLRTYRRIQNSAHPLVCSGVMYINILSCIYNLIMFTQTDVYFCHSLAPPSCFGSVRFSSLQTGRVVVAGSPQVENFQSGQKTAIRVDSLLLAATSVFMYLYFV